MGKLIKLVALDIDGTIFKTGGTISARVKDAIQATRNKGVLVTLCTGRWHSIMVSFCHELGMDPDDIHITSNGSVILTTAGQVFDRVPIERDALLPFMESLSKKEIGYGLCDERDFYVNAKGYEPHATGDDAKQFIFIQHDDEFKKIDYVSKLYVNTVEHGAYVDELLSGLPFDYASDFAGEFDIWPKATNKGIALQKLAMKQGISMEDVMFVGDGSNDLMALSMVGKGVAMGQASEHVKSFADVIAPSFADDGAAWAIEEFILKR